MLYAKLDTQHGELLIANAGHNYPVLLNGQVCELELSGMPLGVDEDSEYREVRASIEPGDIVVLYTDGVVEASAPDAQIYSYGRLEQMLRANAQLKPRALMAALLHELRAWNGTDQADDITMVIIRRRLARAGDELRSSAEDVLGHVRTAEIWAAAELPAPGAPAALWAARIPNIVSLAQNRFGRGLARELNAQLRLTLEEYR